MEVVIAAYLAYHVLIFEQQQRDFNHSRVYTLLTRQAFKFRFHSRQSFSDWPCHDARVCVCVYKYFWSYRYLPVVGQFCAAMN